MKTLGNASRVYPPRTIGNGPSMNLPYTDLANIFTAAQRISLATSGTIAELFGTENSATANVIDHYRTRAGGAGVAGDDLFEEQFNGNDSTSAKTKFARTLSEIVDPTNGSEDGRYSIGTMRAGTVVDWQLESGTLRYQGLTLPTTAGAINATDLQAAGVSLAHGIVQVVRDTNAVYTTLGTQMPADNTIPQITEGDEILSVSITPKSATSTLRIRAVLSVGHGAAGGQICAAIFVDATANALNAGGISAGNSALLETLVLEHAVAAGSTSARTYRVRAGSGTTTDAYLNGNATARIFGGVAISSLEVEEILAQ